MLPRAREGAGRRGRGAGAGAQGRGGGRGGGRGEGGLGGLGGGSEAPPSLPPPPALARPLGARLYFLTEKVLFFKNVKTVNPIIEILFFLIYVHGYILKGWDGEGQVRKQKVGRKETETEKKGRALSQAGGAVAPPPPPLPLGPAPLPPLPAPPPPSPPSSSHSPQSESESDHSPKGLLRWKMQHSCFWNCFFFKEKETTVRFSFLLFFYLSLVSFRLRSPFPPPPLTLRALLAGHLIVDDVLGPLDCLLRFVFFECLDKKEKEEREVEVFVHERPTSERGESRNRQT